MCPVGGQHTCVFGGSAIRWLCGVLFCIVACMACPVPIITRLNPTFGVAIIHQESQTAPSARAHSHGRAAQAPTVRRTHLQRVAVAGGAPESKPPEGSAVIPETALSASGPTAPARLHSASSKTQPVHPLVSAFQLPFPPSSIKIQARASSKTIAILVLAPHSRSHSSSAWFVRGCGFPRSEAPSTVRVEVASQSHWC